MFFSVGSLHVEITLSSCLSIGTVLSAAAASAYDSIHTDDLKIQKHTVNLYREEVESNRAI